MYSSLSLNPPSVHSFLLYLCQTAKTGFSLEVTPIIISPPPLSSPRFSFHPVNRCVNRRCTFVSRNSPNSHHHSDNPHVCHFETLLAVGGDLLQLLQLRFVFTSHFFLYSFQTNTPLPERLGLDHYCTTA